MLKDAGVITKPVTAMKQGQKESAGYFAMFGIGERPTELNLLPIKISRKTRDLPTSPEDGEPRSLRCFSEDGKSPLSCINDPVSPVCGEYKPSARGEVFFPLCPKAQWGAVDDEVPTPPECRETLHLLCLDVDRGISIQMLLRGREKSAFLQHMREDTTAWRAGEHPRYYTHAYIKYDTALLSGPYYRLCFDTKKIPEEKIESVKSFYQNYMSERSGEPAASTADESLTEEQLRDKYGHWGDHPEFLCKDWIDEVRQGDTRHGYWKWVEKQLTDK